MTSPSARQLILPALSADALSLSCHWIYDSAKIEHLYPAGIREYDDPHSPYHPGKSAGDLTHYGDQTIALLKSVVLRGGFDPLGWRDDWLRFWKSNPPAYRDGATRATLGFLERGVDAASESNDLAGASRIAPVLAALSNQPLGTRIAAARAQTALTHGNLATIDAAEFFTRVVDLLTLGNTVHEALDAAASANYEALDARGFLNSARVACKLDENQVGEKLGLACQTPEAFPLTLWFLLRFHDQPLEAIVRNTMTGGDNSARGMLIGLVIGAAHGTAWIPHTWTEGLRDHNEIESLLTILESRSKSSS